LLLVSAVVCMVAGLWAIYGPDASEKAVSWPIAYWMHSPWQPHELTEWKAHVTIIGALLLLQWMFLCPSRRWRIRMSQRGRPIRAALVAGACMAMLLTFGLIATLSEIVFDDNWGELIKKRDNPASGWHAIAIMAVLWLFWTLVFWRYRRPMDGIARIGGIATALVAGSLLEIIVAVGVLAWNPQQEDCWCARGSYTGLVFGATVLVWAFGPALIPLFFRQVQLRRRPSRQSDSPQQRRGSG